MVGPTRVKGNKTEKEKNTRMGWPPVWGWFYWRYLHLIAWYRDKDEPVPVETLERLNKFLKFLFANLPCPQCGYHASAYLQENPIQENSTYGALFQWTVSIHNSVNTRNQVPEWTLEEVENDLANKLKNPKEHNDFLLWSVLLLTGIICVGKNLEKDHAKKITQFLEFLEDAAVVFPYTEVGDKMVVQVRALQNRLRDNGAAGFVDEFNTMYKLMAGLRNCCVDSIRISDAEMERRLMNHYQKENYMDLVRAVQIREEDQKKMKELNEEVEKLTRQLREKCPDSAATPSDSAATPSGESMQMFNMYYGMILILCIFCIVLYTVLYRRSAHGTTKQQLLRQQRRRRRLELRKPVGQK